MKDRIMIVCALADSPFTVPGSRFDLACHRCGRKVMIAPTGQRRLRQYPDAAISCGTCWAFQFRPGDIIETAGTVDELRNESRTSTPNLRRYRN